MIFGLTLVENALQSFLVEFICLSQMFLWRMEAVVQPFCEIWTKVDKYVQKIHCQK
jgi:hypothetical protein